MALEIANFGLNQRMHGVCAASSSCALKKLNGKEKAGF